MLEEQFGFKKKNLTNNMLVKIRLNYPKSVYFASMK